NVDVVEDVEAFPLEVLVRHFFDLDAKIAGLAAAQACVACAAKGEIVSFEDAGRYGHGNRLLSSHTPVPSAVGAAVSDETPFALAVRAGLYVHELAENGTGNLTDLAGSLTRRTDLVAGFAPLCAGGVADLARHELSDLDLLLDALGDFFERQGQFDAQIAPGSTIPAAAAALPGEDLLEDGARSPEDVAEGTEDVIYILETWLPGPIATNAGGSEAVITLALLWIREHLVSLGCFLELLLGLRIVSV